MKNFYLICLAIFIHSLLTHSMDVKHALKNVFMGVDGRQCLGREIFKSCENPSSLQIFGKKTRYIKSKIHTLTTI